MQNVEQTIISQYANSPTLIQLINNFNDYIDPGANIDAFYNYVWNVDTAVGYGLDVWGRIVGVDRQIAISGVGTFFGFNDGVDDYAPFNSAPFFSGSFGTGVYTLTDDAYRTLILVKALANISDCTAPAVNRLLSNLFASRGRCYVLDLGGMRIRYIFEFALENYELTIIQNSGAIPRPAGVAIEIYQAATPTFGFAEAGPSAAPWGQGPFIA